jgi:hypothetical protein
MLAIRPKTNHRQKRRWGLSSSRQTRQTLPRSEKKRKENVYVCALPVMQKKRETSEISNPKEEQKSLTERFFDCATRWPLIDPFAVTRENNFVSTNIQIIKGTKIRLAFAFASRARRRVYDEERNISVKRLLVLLLRTKIARTKKTRAARKRRP